MICYDDYPLRIVVVNLVELLAALVLGAVLVAQLGWWAVLFYGAMGCLGLILSLAYGCTRCRYYGRVCGLGLGKIASHLFREREQGEFGRSPSQTVAWTLVGLILALPVAAGLVSLATGPLWATLAVLGLYLAVVIAIVLTHSRFVCAHCHQARDRRCTLGRVARLT